MFLTKDQASPSYVLVSSSQHVTEKQALAKVIGKVVVTQTQSFTIGSVLVPHCRIRPFANLTYPFSVSDAATIPPVFAALILLIMSLA